MGGFDKCYIDWLCSFVYDRKNSSKSYDLLFEKLSNTEFVWSLMFDKNRAADGLKMRERFMEEIYWPDGVCIATSDQSPSLLEVLVSLSLRCEDFIMSDDSVGNRTGQWFWGMIVNLGLGGMHDKYYDEDYVDFVINRFLNREYDPDGKGGLFYIPNRKEDVRDVEIWYQLNWYLSDILEQEGEGL